MGWFGIDFISIIPFDLILPNNKKYNNMAKYLKVARLYRLLKLSKLMRMLKVLRDKNNLLKWLTEILRIGIGAERLFFAIISIILFCHVGACTWYYISETYPDRNSWVMKNNMQDKTKWEKYFTSFY